MPVLHMLSCLKKKSSVSTSIYINTNRFTLNMVFKVGMGWLGRRFWESRQFYSAYIALFVSITNWITIQYKLLLENIPVLNILFSNIWVFMIVAVIVFTIISILGGHYIHRKRQFRIEQAVATEENPYLYLACSWEGERAISTNCHFATPNFGGAFAI